MKILLDENLPDDLKYEFQNMDIYSVNDMKWNSKKNGELLTLMVENNFDVLITLDQNLKFQQNLSKFKIQVVCLKVPDSKIETSKPFVPKILEILRSNLKDKYIEI